MWSSLVKVDTRDGRSRNCRHVRSRNSRLEGVLFCKACRILESNGTSRVAWIEFALEVTVIGEGSLVCTKLAALTSHRGNARRVELLVVYYERYVTWEGYATTGESFLTLLQITPLSMSAQTWRSWQFLPTLADVWSRSASCLLTLLGFLSG